MDNIDFENPVRLDVFLADSAWREIGAVDLCAIEEDAVTRMVRTEKGLTNSPIQYFRCSTIEAKAVTDIQAALAADEKVYCRIAVDVENEKSFHIELALAVREIYQCAVNDPDGAVNPDGIPIAELRWMLTGLHFSTMPAD